MQCSVLFIYHNSYSIVLKDENSLPILSGVAVHVYLVDRETAIQNKRLKLKNMWDLELHIKVHSLLKK